MCIRDRRRPLLLLGELSKRSLGTFRWLQRGQADSWIPKFAQMTEEIEKQYVLTYFLGADEDPAGKKVKVVTIGRTEATSNELKVPDALCNREVCAGYCTSDRCIVPQPPEGRGVFGWVVLIGGIGLGAILVLGLIGYALSHRSQRIPLPPGMLPPPPLAKPMPMPMPMPVSRPPMVMAPAVAPHLMFCLLYTSDA